MRPQTIATKKYNEVFNFAIGILTDRLASFISYACLFTTIEKVQRNREKKRIIIDESIIIIEYKFTAHRYIQRYRNKIHRMFVRFLKSTHARDSFENSTNTKIEWFYSSIEIIYRLLHRMTTHKVYGLFAIACDIGNQVSIEFPVQEHSNYRF